MTATYPLDMPDVLKENAPRCKFDYTPLGGFSRSLGGRTSFQEKVGSSLWQFSVTTKGLRRSEYDDIVSFFRLLRGGSKTFKAYDLHRCYPMAYGDNLPATRHSGAPFDGTCTVTAAGGSTVSLSGLPSTYIASKGDYISFDYIGGRNVLAFLERKVAVAGVIANIEAGPWLLAGGSVPATGLLVRSWCLMKPMPGSWSGSERQAMSAASFEAVQHLV